MSTINIFSVLNYQGSKKALLEFIHKNTEKLISPSETVLDIFSGTSSVGYSFKDTHTVYANDSEYYAYVIARALLASNYEDTIEIINNIEARFYSNYSYLEKKYSKHMQDEETFITKQNVDNLIALYQDFPTIWNKKVFSTTTHLYFDLFTTYYAGTYFGIMQAATIDSIRFAIECYRNTDVYYAMLTALFFAMKETVFSKDGHMAQPLNPASNGVRMLNMRKKNIFKLFFEKFNMFFSENFIRTLNKNKCFHMDFEALLLQQEIRKNVDLIYADPPYTDMQYSRYYHLLNTVALYQYPQPSVRNGGYTKGLYVEGRFQSKLSQKSTCLAKMKKLAEFSNETHKQLAISFAYPVDTKKQKTNRYVMDVRDLIQMCKDVFSASKVSVETLDYQHSNNRNSTPKKVKEYLILCRGK